MVAYNELLGINIFLLTLGLNNSCHFEFMLLQRFAFSAPTLSEDDEEEGGQDNTLAWDDSSIHVASGSTPVNGSFVPAIGGPFSALTPSMWPQDILSRIQQVNFEINRNNHNLGV